MKIGGLAKAAVDILNDFSVNERPIAHLLKKWALTHRYAGSSDRHSISNIIYDALRLRGAAHALLQTEEWPAVVLYVILLQQPTLLVEELAAALRQDKYASNLLEYLPNSSIISTNIESYVKSSMPIWLRPYFSRSFEDNYINEMTAFLKRPPIDIRVNLLKASPGQVLNFLRNENMQVTYAMQGVPFIEQALRLLAMQRMEKKLNLEKTKAFAQGYFEIQDLGSQLLAKLVDAKPEMQILDYCAGAGGKALALSIDMKNKGQIYVHDIDKQRLSDLPTRMQRAGAKNIKPAMHPAVLESLLGLMDIVVVDAPCSGSGTWRRAPDRKWLFTPVELFDVIKKQTAILNKAAKYVKPGGYLYYMTCSIFVEENDEQIEHFLHQHPNFTFRNISSFSIPCYNTAYGILLSPHKTGSDGFYISALKRML